LVCDRVLPRDGFVLSSFFFLCVCNASVRCRPEAKNQSPILTLILVLNFYFFKKIILKITYKRKWFSFLFFKSPIVLFKHWLVFFFSFFEGIKDRLIV